MYKKITFIFFFSMFCFGNTQINAATKSCKSFYDDHKVSVAHLKEDVAKYREKIGEKSVEIQDKSKKDLKHLDEMMASLDAHMMKMDAKVNPANETKKLKHSLSRCKAEKAEITKLISKIEKLFLKLDKELVNKTSGQDHKNMKKEVEEKNMPSNMTEAPHDSSGSSTKDSFWERVKKLFH